MRKELKAYIELELRDYSRTKNELACLEEEIILGSSKEECEGRSNIPGRPTEQKAIKLTTNRRLAQMERTIRAIDSVVARLDEDKYKLVDLMYWKQPQILTPYGLAMELHISQRTVYNWADEICLAVAVEMGLIDAPELKTVITRR